MFPDKQVVGHPKPVVKWYRSGKEILADGTKIKAQEFKGGYYQLVITAADENDATVYQVRATNSSGSISTTANLEVEGGYYEGTRDLRQGGTLMESSLD